MRQYMLAAGSYLSVVPLTTIAASREAAGFHLSDLVRQPHHHIAEHEHRHATLSLVLAGEAKERSTGIEIHSCWPKVLYRPPRLRHENWFGPEGTRTFVIRLPENIVALPQRLIAADGMLTLLIYNCYLALDAPAEQLSRHIRQALAHLREPPSGKPGWLAAVLRRLRFDPPPRLEELAAIAGLHPVYVARAFRKHVGCSVGEHVRRQRLDRASRLLFDAAIPLADVAAATGFSDQSHLSRHLKAATGHSPAWLRRTVLQVRAVQDSGKRAT